ncbi:GPP34 family phosphoprotein [Streptomyces sp. NPDC005955]|uniref:GOLPH3/VPS74 family protein n=1 Tax=Streptomyces sp. NPDC005955 TaxID=3364738 RepID=UPI0036D1C9CB
MPHGSLSLPARLYLLSWDTTRLRVTGASQLPHLVRAGALTELAQRGLLTDEEGVVRVTDPDVRTGDTVLDGLLELIAESRPRKWKSWVTSRTGVTLDAVREQLVAEGYLGVGRKRVLGVFPSVDYTLERVPVVSALRTDARAALTGPEPVDEVGDRDAAVVALAVAAEVRTFSSSKERRAHKVRVDALTARSGAVAPALGKAIREMQAALAVAVTSVAVTSS